MSSAFGVARVGQGKMTVKRRLLIVGASAGNEERKAFSRPSR